MWTYIYTNSHGATGIQLSGDCFANLGNFGLNSSSQKSTSQWGHELYKKMGRLPAPTEHGVRNGCERVRGTSNSIGGRASSRTSRTEGMGAKR